MAGQTLHLLRDNRCGLVKVPGRREDSQNGGRMTCKPMGALRAPAALSAVLIMSWGVLLCSRLRHFKAVAQPIGCFTQGYKASDRLAGDRSPGHAADPALARVSEIPHSF